MQIQTRTIAFAVSAILPRRLDVLLSQQLLELIRDADGDLTDRPVVFHRGIGFLNDQRLLKECTIRHNMPPKVKMPRTTTRLGNPTTFQELCRNPRARLGHSAAEGPRRSGLPPGSPDGRSDLRIGHEHLAGHLANHGLPRAGDTGPHRRITKICQSGSAVRYDPQTHRHHYLVCLRCGKISDSEDPRLDRLPQPHLPGGEFEVHDYCIHFRGLYRACGARTKPIREPQGRSRKQGGRTTGKRLRRTRGNPERRSQ